MLRRAARRGGRSQARPPAASSPIQAGGQRRRVVGGDAVELASEQPHQRHGNGRGPDHRRAARRPATRAEPLRVRPASCSTRSVTRACWQDERRRLGDARYRMAVNGRKATLKSVHSATSLGTSRCPRTSSCAGRRIVHRLFKALQRRGAGRGGSRSRRWLNESTRRSSQSPRRRKHAPANDRHLRATIANAVDPFFAYLSRANASGSRGTALAPLHTMFALVLAAFLTSIHIMAPRPVLVLFGILCLVAFVLECGAYMYLLRYDRDALRSERFTLEKLRLQKGLMGDSVSGFREIRVGDNAKELADASSDRHDIE